MRRPQPVRRRSLRTNALRSQGGARGHRNVRPASASAVPSRGRDASRSERCISCVPHKIRGALPSIPDHASGLGRRWTHWALRDQWISAGRVVGIEGVKLYEGTKHTMATDAVRRGVSERALQTYLGHADVRSTRRYARLSDEALVSVLRTPPRDAATEDDLSHGCPTALSVPSNLLINKEKLASPTGIEPVLRA
jgi:hypothetical protein